MSVNIIVVSGRAKVGLRYEISCPMDRHRTAAHAWGYFLLRGGAVDATYENLSAFVRKHGAITILDTQGRARKLPSGETDMHDVIDKADRFVFAGKWYSRSEFESLMEQIK
jgi:hypothetical protein